MGLFSSQLKVVYASIGLSTSYTLTLPSEAEAKTYLEKLLDKLNSSDGFIELSPTMVVRKDKINFLELRYD